MNGGKHTVQHGDEILCHGRFTIPADEPALLRFYLEELLVPHSRAETVSAPLVRRLPGLARAGLLKARAGRWEERALADLLEEAGLAPEGPLTRISLGDYGGSARSKTITFLFEEGGSRPLAIVKESAVPDQQARLAHEQVALRTLGEMLPASLRDTVPMPLGERRRDAVVQFVETFAGGSFLYRDLRRSLRPRRLADRHFQLAGDWLLAFQKATIQGEVVLDDANIAQHLLDPFEALKRRGGVSPEVARFGREVAQRAGAFAGQRLPLVARHGDYWARNILVEGDLVRVIDWEGFEAARPPFHDWFHFALSYGLSFPWRIGRWEEPETAFNATLARRGPLRPLIHRELTRAAKALGVSPALALLFLPVTLAERALLAPGDERWPRLLAALARDPALIDSLAHE